MRLVNITVFIVMPFHHAGKQILIFDFLVRVLLIHSPRVRNTARYAVGLFA